MRRMIVLLTSMAIAILLTPATGLSAAHKYPASALCGDSANGFDKWRASFKQMALGYGISQRVLNEALDNITYSTRVTHLDRNQKSFKLSFDEFMQKRGADYIVAKGRKLKEKNAKLFQRIEDKYGVPSGILLAIWGMESAFGRYTGNMEVISSLATLAYDCRRSEFFTRELLAALKIVQNGDMHPNQMIGAWAGEMGQTQFLATNYVKYAVDFDGDGKRDLIRSKADALASTANFLLTSGWVRGKGYQPGQRNYAAIAAWNRAEVYQKALAIIARRIDSKSATQVNVPASNQRSFAPNSIISETLKH